MSKIKLWFVRRWLHLLPEKELSDEITRRGFDKAFRRLSRAMLNNHFYYADEDTVKLIDDNFEELV